MTSPRLFALAILGLEREYYRRYVLRRYPAAAGFPTVELETLCPSLEERVDPYGWLDGGSLPIDLALLKQLARRFHRCRYLEIGTWRGESLANVATVAESCYSLSLSDEEMRALGWGQPFIDTSRVFSAGLPNVTHLGHDSRSFDFGLLPPVDLVFVDGDHSYQGVLHDTRNAFQVLRDETSIIVWHDYARSPERDVSWEVVAGILDGCPPEKRQFLYHVANTLCAVYLPDTLVPTRQVRFPELPRAAFQIHIRARRWRNAPPGP